MRIWGYWATLGWGLLAFVLSQFIALGVLVAAWLSSVQTLLTTPFDGAMVTIFILVSNPVMIAVVALAVLVARASQVDYLALKLVPARELKIGLIGLVVLIVASDLLLYLGGRDLVTPFQLQSYASAGAEGWLLPMLAAAILVAPAGEEVMFRGFLFRGWARSERTVWPAIIVISLLWATLHVQYDWTGIVQIFAIGLFLGWIRWRSGSTLLTFLLHALFNLEGTMETVLHIRFFP
jgi:membrane protease YdiL (CAAX protease family)